MKIGLFISALLFSFMMSCHSMSPESEGTKPISHKLFNDLLKKYVDDQGMVDYKGFASENGRLKVYLDALEKNGPNDQHWSQLEQLAYWINAYNAFTIQLILDYYPVESIKDIGANVKIPFVNTAWDIKFIKIGGEELSLNNIEHNIIRKNFDEPRIHFALVCAAQSCPKLRNEAYAAASLDEQLTDQAKFFLSNSEKNELSENEIKLSKIFSWYAGDFTNDGSLIEYINQFTPVTVNEKAKKSYKKYNWALNEK